MRRRWTLTILAIGAGALLLGLACTSSGLTDEAIARPTRVPGPLEQAVRSAVDAYNREDSDAFLAAWTDHGLEAAFGATREEIVAAGAQIFGGPTRMLRTLTATQQDGSRGSTEAEFIIGKSIQKERIQLVQQSGVWRIDGSERIDLEIPSGVEEVDVELADFAFALKTRIAGGNIALQAQNSGKQPHELVVLQVPSDFELNAASRAALTQEGPPPGSEVVGFAGPVPPGDDANLVMTDPLAPGKYLMACFLPDSSDPSLAPHAAKGMVAEFTIP